MAILPKVGCKSLKMRIVVGVIYFLLIAGSITMVYPFLIMLSGSVKGQSDILRMDPVPQMLYSEQVQFSRFQEDRYGILTYISAAYGEELARSSDTTIPKVDEKELATYRKFLRENIDDFPEHFYRIQESTSDQSVLTRNFRKFKDEIRKECGTVEEFSKRYNAPLTSWNDFPGIVDNPLIKEFSYESDPFTERCMRFKISVPASEKAILNIDGYYYISQKTFHEVRSGKVQRSKLLTARCPKGPEKVLWAEFVKHRLNCMFVRLDSKGLELLRGYLSAKYPSGIAKMNAMNDTSYRSFESIRATNRDMRSSAFFALHTDFVTNHCPPEHLIVDTPSTRYREYVGNAAAVPPFVAGDYAVFGETKKPFLREIMTRNYVTVVEFVAVYGRAIFNTVIFIGLSILAALIVNPLAAYALSRFKLKHTYSILMFFLGTMAFPGAVTMIPNFLLLKNLHLLNSFWALILPSVANGYAIFILKGFFDSIPKEIYESAQLDGASEWTMFWRFTMALSTPILALITLGAFTAAYTAFMFALIICPDQKMWTLMVWLYQLQQSAHQSVIYAALVLAAIPTLLIFVLAQNVIMKGIVVPVEK